MTTEKERDCQLILMGGFGRIDLSVVRAFSVKPHVDQLGGPGGITQVRWIGRFTLDKNFSRPNDEVIYMASCGYKSSSFYQYVDFGAGKASTFKFSDVGLSIKLPHYPDQAVVLFTAKRREMM